jgi:hypothetical protein
MVIARPSVVLIKGDDLQTVSDRSQDFPKARKRSGTSATDPQNEKEISKR